MAGAIMRALLMTGLLAGCGSATQIPVGGQTVQVSATAGELRLEPAVVRPGDVYLVLADSAASIEFIHRTSDFNDPHAPPLPVTDDDIRSVEQYGTFEGAGHDVFSVGGYGNVFEIGPLVEGRYVFVLDATRLAVLEVRD